MRRPRPIPRRTWLLAGAASAVLLAGLLLAIPGSARATVCHGHIAAVSGDQQLLAARNNPVTQALSNPNISPSDLETAGEEDAAQLAAIVPCSLTGEQVQQDMLAFDAVQLAAAGCRAIVKAEPTLAGVDEMLACIAPVNAEAEALERALAMEESVMVAHPCTGSGVAKRNAVPQALAKLKAKLAQQKRAEQVISVTSSITGGLAADSDASELIKGVNDGSDTIVRLIKAAGVARTLTSTGHRGAPLARLATTATAAPPGAGLWAVELANADRYATTFNTDLTAVRTDVAAGRRKPARVASGKAQLMLDLTVGALRSAGALQAHFATDLAGDATLQTPITQTQLAPYLAQITAGKVKLSDSGVLTIAAADRGYVHDQIAALVGQTPLALISGSTLTTTTTTLLSGLQTVDVLAVTNRTQG